MVDFETNFTRIFAFLLDVLLLHLDYCLPRSSLSLFVFNRSVECKLCDTVLRTSYEIHAPKQLLVKLCAERVCGLVSFKFIYKVMMKACPSANQTLLTKY